VVPYAQQLHLAPTPQRVLSNLSRSLQSSDSRKALRLEVQALTQVGLLQEQLADAERRWEQLADAERRCADAERRRADATEQFRKITQAQNDRLRARAPSRQTSSTVPPRGWPSAFPRRPRPFCS
jgi:post-segregation antitoxin (ccd killing protein)